MKTFESFLQHKFLEEYHGDKEHFEDAYETWLSELDIQEVIDYAEECVEPLAEKAWKYDELN